ncbi:MAG: hypothetical protein UV57_C0003G0005 [Parcubacteria group bacterium GW2011_GWD2_43_10]|uniref:Uncharacterized protein n=3 Tax=Candidatus Vebleniibacteriota TaxID=1817921 RepID=A0A1G2Q7L5_9BACT|nr:MAG: hypothetical protein UV52_C0010G0013 [Parcubacteria group bacterium GW2011_GWD1_42_9]KKS83971.1 MAG: hypothetical protein UV57_C0003G0005 [Parcubacteria group bacterium GW2011_GWD2_43_10]KKS94116.1 MAG: hypothetical protein UV69_C0001G0005 [Parcubacteria group bacterium GW2011_GWE2_43_12]KKT14039.1 MAG: hypothetical protein UV92_C0008G0030 [Parcubacteria group bacterium GW2011_GWA1_43_27]KKT21322.1 MAG: hypothetical protein UW06_C0039G0007 [Parcubacteria group bacterium GW2011_GWE1_43_8
MSYTKKLMPILAIAVAAGFLTDYIGLFNFGWMFIAAPAAAGVLLAIVQNETSSYRFLDKLVIGSFVYSFIFAGLAVVHMYFSSVDWYLAHPKLSFGMSFNFLDHLWLALALSFIAFMGGLVGIVGKGFYILHSAKSASASNSSLREVNAHLSLVGRNRRMV